ncbi:hypothetical protein LJC56_05140 [Christensenellaceae bacterium OttesenSCG-928-K19]|nr:hypothetical protein [Christensenellaceae bacterium OttesenSCG-928-K19]
MMGNALKIPVEVNLNWKVPDADESMRPNYQRIDPNYLIFEDGQKFEFQVVGRGNGANRRAGISGFEYKIRVYNDVGTYSDTYLYFEGKDLYDPKAAWYVVRRQAGQS